MRRVFGARPPRSHDLDIFAYTVAAAPTLGGFNLAVLPPSLFALWVVVTGAMSFMTSGFLLAFTVLVPEDRAPNRWRGIALRVAFAIIILLGILGEIEYGQTAFVLGAHVPAALTAFATALVVVALIARLATMEATERTRFRWAAFAIGWAVLLDLPRNAPIVLGGLEVGKIAGMLSVVTPLVLLYAVLKRHVIDIRFAVSRTLVYAIITALVAAIVGLVDWATSAYLHEARIAMALDALATIAVAFALNHVHRWVERAVDLALFRNKYAAQEYVERLAASLLEAQREETVHNELARGPFRAFNLTMAAVYRAAESVFVLFASAGELRERPAFDPDHELVRFMNGERRPVHIHDLAYQSQAQIAIPIFQRKRLSGFVLYGPHFDGTPLDPDELHTLKRLCDAAAQAYILIAYERYNALPQVVPA